MFNNIEFRLLSFSFKRFYSNCFLLVLCVVLSSKLLAFNSSELDRIEKAYSSGNVVEAEGLIKEYMAQNRPEYYPVLLKYLHDIKLGFVNDSKVKKSIYLSEFLLLKSAAKAGDIRSQFFLYQKYKWNKYGIQDTEKALYWIKKAAENGTDFVIKERDSYIQYLQDVKSGKAEALFDHAVSMIDIYNSSEDKEYINEIILEAANKGSINAQKSIAAKYRYGKEFEKNIEKAIFWYSKAAEQGDEEAKFLVEDIKYCEANPEEC